MVIKSKTSFVFLLIAILILILAVASCSFEIVTPASNSIPPSSSSSTARSTPNTSINPSVEPISIAPSIATNSAFPDFVSIITAVEPSVVAITTKVTGYNVFGNAIMEQGTGSGWIIDKNGLIVTNNHVVEGASNVSVTLRDGRTFTADSVHTDPVADLAIVKINAQDLPALRLGDSSKLQVGQWVIAIGNSLGMGISATKGIVSALGVTLSESQGQALYDLIQTDAAINPGNSGGPLVDLSGNVIGINSAKVAAVGVEGMGYAISTKAALPIINDLIKNGYVIRPYFGADFYTVDRSIARRYRLAVNAGALVTQIYTSGPADKAGIIAGDVIINIDGKNVISADDLSSILQSDQIGQKVKLTYYRGSSQKTVTAILTQTAPP